MNFIFTIYKTIFYQPIFLLLFLFFLFSKDLGISIILLAFLIRLVFFPLSRKMLKNEKKLEKIRALISEIEKKYKDNFEKRMAEILKIYQKEKFNPLPNFLILIFQFPVLYSVYQILKEPETFSSPTFLNFVNLQKPSLFLPLFVGAIQIFQILKKKSPGNFVAYFSTLFLVFALAKLPAAVSLYVLANYIFGIFERFLVLKRI